MRPCVLAGACGILSGVTFAVETEEEADGRWIAEIPQIPGAMSYGNTRDEAIARVEALGLHVLVDRGPPPMIETQPRRAPIAIGQLEIFP